MPIELTPELASRCLDVWERRLRDPKGTRYASTILEAALYGAADFAPTQHMPIVMRRHIAEGREQSIHQRQCPRRLPHTAHRWTSARDRKYFCRGKGPLDG